MKSVQPLNKRRVGHKLFVSQPHDSFSRGALNPVRAPFLRIDNLTRSLIVPQIAVRVLGLPINLTQDAESAQFEINKIRPPVWTIDGNLRVHRVPV